MIRCPQFIESSEQSGNACIVCKMSASEKVFHNLLPHEKERVIQEFCNADYKKCKYYTGYIPVPGVSSIHDAVAVPPDKCPYCASSGNNIICADPKTGEVIKKRNTTAEGMADIMNTFCTGNFCRCGVYKNIQKIEEEKQMGNEMSKITTVNEGEIPQKDVYAEAQHCHAEIVSNIAITETALLKICRNLKTIRDKKLYEVLGYGSFGEYVEENGDYCFKERQAYNYISTYEKLGPQYIEDHAAAGITKLSLITQLSNFERNEAFEGTSIEGMSTAEIKEIVDSYRKQGDQLSFLQAESKSAEEKLKETEAKLEAALREKEIIAQNAENSRLIAVEAARKQGADETEKRLVQQTRAEALEYEKAIEDLKDKLAEAQSASPSPEVIENIEKQAELKAEKKFKAEIDQLKADAKEAEKKAKEKIKAEKEKAQKAVSQSNADKSIVAFELYFNEMQKNLKGFLNTIEAVEDETRKAGFKEAFKKYLNIILEQL